MRKPVMEAWGGSIGHEFFAPFTEDFVIPAIKGLIKDRSRKRLTKMPF